MTEQVEQLLQKIAVTKQAIDGRLETADSDLAKLYHLGNQQLIALFQNTLKSDMSEAEKKETLTTLLKARWHDIQGTSETYCAKPRDPLNQLCLSIAEYISPLPENIEDCDDWGVGEGPYFILMPTLKACEDIILGTNIHQYRLHEFILSDDGKRFIPLFYTLDYFYKGSNEKPIHTVFTQDQLADPTINPQGDLLSEHEFQRVVNHSAATQKVMNALNILKNPNADIGNRLLKLADGLYAGSSHGGVGKGDNAAEPANVAILEFFEYWDALPNQIRAQYLRKVPKLEGILKRLSDPVGIARQGINYCVGLTGGDLRFLVRENLHVLQEDDIKSLKKTVGDWVADFETAIQSSAYQVTPPNDTVIPFASRVIDIPPAEQQRLIKQYLGLDYPNFLLYAFEEQPQSLSRFIKAFSQSQHKAALLQQRDSQGTSILLMTAQYYPDVLLTLLEAAADLDAEMIANELMVTTSSGDSLPLLIMQKQPDALPKLMQMVQQLPQAQQFKLLTSLTGEGANLMMIALQSQPDAFASMCDLVSQLPQAQIAELLLHVNERGDNLLMLALRHYPHAVEPLMPLFVKLNKQDKQRIVQQQNAQKLSLPILALGAKPEHFAKIDACFQDFPTVKKHTLLTQKNVISDNLLHLACRYSAQNFEYLLPLMDNLLNVDKVKLLGQTDSGGNHLLLLAMLHLDTPSEGLFERIRQQKPEWIANYLVHPNAAGLSPLILAFSQRPSYIANIVSLIDALPDELSESIWQQTTINDWPLPFLTLMYQPEQFDFMMDKWPESQVLTLLQHTDINQNTMLMVAAKGHQEHLPGLLKRLEKLSPEQRFELMNQTNQQGDNLLMVMLQQDSRCLPLLYQVMSGMTSQQIEYLFCQKNHQNQMALTKAYATSPILFTQVFQQCDQFKQTKDADVLAALTIQDWFALLAQMTSDKKTFSTYYQLFKTLHPDEIGQLHTQQDSMGNHLFMMVIQYCPGMVDAVFRDIKLCSDVDKKTVMFHRNHLNETVLHQAKQHANETAVTQINGFAQRLNKKQAQEILRGMSISMHSGEAFISVEQLEEADADQLMALLQDKKGLDSNTFGQVIQRAPHLVGSVLAVMDAVLDDEQIKTVLAEPNTHGHNAYWLAVQAAQTPYLQQNLQARIDCFSSEVQMALIDPEGQSIITCSLRSSQKQFESTMRWLAALDASQQRQVLQKFWSKTSPDFRQALINGEVEIVQRLILSAQQLPMNEQLAILKRNINAISVGLCQGSDPIRAMCQQWLVRLSDDARFEVLKQLSAEAIVSLLDEATFGVIDMLTLHQQAALFSRTNAAGKNVFIHAIQGNHPSQVKLLQRLVMMTPEDQSSIFLSSGANQSLLIVLAEENPALCASFLKQLPILSSETQRAILQMDNSSGWTLLDTLTNQPELYDQVLQAILSLNQLDMAKCFVQQSGIRRDNLLFRVPNAYRARLLQKLKTLPQSVQIELLMQENAQHENGVMRMMQLSPQHIQMVLTMMQTFPKHIQGQLLLKQSEQGDSLLTLALNANDVDLVRQILEQMKVLPKTQLAEILLQKQGGVSLFHRLAEEHPDLCNVALKACQSLPAEQMTELLVQQDSKNRDILKILADAGHAHQFARVSELIARLPESSRVRVLNNTNCLPAQPVTLWQAIFYGSEQAQNFVAIVENKDLYPSMFRLLQSAPPSMQVTILTNRIGVGRQLLDTINQPEQSELKFVLETARKLVESQNLLNTMSKNITDEAVNNPKGVLYRKLTQSLEFYQSTYDKTPRQAEKLMHAWVDAIQEEFPKIDDKLSWSNLLVGLLKTAVAILIPFYGAYKLYEKVSTNRSVLFKTDREQTIYRLEDLSSTLTSQTKEQDIPKKL